MSHLHRYRHRKSDIQLKIGEYHCLDSYSLEEYYLSSRLIICYLLQTGQTRLGGDLRKHRNYRHHLYDIRLDSIRFNCHDTGPLCVLADEQASTVRFLFVQVFLFIFQFLYIFSTHTILVFFLYFRELIVNKRDDITAQRFLFA